MNSMKLTPMSAKLDRDEIRRKAIEVARAELAPRPVEFDDTTPCADIDVDSIDVIQIIFRLEEEFKIEINAPPYNSFVTMGDLFDVIVESIIAGSS